MKKLVMATMLTVIGATSAQAGVDIGINLGGPAYVEPVPVGPVYAEPAPYYNSYGRGHRHDYDRHFWNQDRRNIHAPAAHHEVARRR